MEHNNHQGGEQQDDNEKNEKLQLTPPRIYVASLADYVAGRLHGSWLEVSGDADELAEGVAAMLAGSRLPGAEEWAIHDYEGFGPLRLGEYETLETVARLARAIAEHGPAPMHWADLVSNTDEATLDEFDNVYQGHWESLTAFADSLWDDCGYEGVLDEVIPEGLRSYVRFDAEAYARDLELGGFIVSSEGDGGVYIFGAP